MAFVPKVHNREVPVANHPVAARSQQDVHGRHLRALHEMSPRVSTRWGSTWNGVREQKQLEQQKLQEERIQRSIRRSQEPVKRRVGKPEMFRSVLVVRKKKVDTDAKDLESEEDKLDFYLNMT